MNWQYADRYGELPLEQAAQIETLFKIAKQLEQLNENLVAIKQKMGEVKISGGVNTHPY